MEHTCDTGIICYQTKTTNEKIPYALVVVISIICSVWQYNVWDLFPSYGTPYCLPFTSFKATFKKLILALGPPYCKG